MKYLSREEQEAFWKRHAESRRKRDERFANLPYEEKLKILEKMRICHEAMRNARLVEPSMHGVR